MPALHLHLGAHNTASTLLQDHMRQHKADLQSSGIAYHGPEDIRPSTTPRLGGSKNTRLAARAATLAAEEKTVGLVVLSEENLIGGYRNIFNRDLLYPDLTDRLSPLRGALPRPPEKIFISICCLESFFVSAYCEALRRSPLFVPFSSYCPPDIRLDALCWSSVIERIHVIFPAAEVVVWRFEDLTTALPRAVQVMFQGIDPRIASALACAAPVRPSLSQKATDLLARVSPALPRAVQLMVQGIDPRIASPLASASPVRPSLSGKAIDLLARVSPPLKGKEYRRIVQAFERLFPKGKMYPGLRPKSLAQIDFQSSYSRDLQRIEAMDKVSVIT
jgi:hypothetical protein